MVVAKADKSRTADDRDDKLVRGFKYVPVFDVSQTEGVEVPVICRPLVGDAPGSCFALLVDAARSLGYRVEDADLAAGTHGDCHFGLRRIRVARCNAPAQRVKTLAHDRLTAPPGARLVYLNGALSRVVHRYTSSSKDGEVTAMPDSGEIDHSVHPSTNPVLPTKNCGQSAMACPR
jgi:hypothetical protein